jgi:hypothetical protein
LGRFGENRRKSEPGKEGGKKVGALTSTWYW